jgi:hypothetical protein
MVREVVSGLLDRLAPLQCAYMLGNQFAVQRFGCVEVCLHALFEWDLSEVAIVMVEHQCRRSQDTRKAPGHFALARAGRPRNADQVGFAQKE